MLDVKDFPIESELGILQSRINNSGNLNGYFMTTLSLQTITYVIIVWQSLVKMFLKIPFHAPGAECLSVPFALSFFANKGHGEVEAASPGSFKLFNMYPIADREVCLYFPVFTY